MIDITTQARRTQVLAALRRYRGHWNRTDHTALELRLLALGEESIHRFELLERIEFLLGAAARGELTGDRDRFARTAARLGVSSRSLERTWSAYRRRGLRGLFAQWLDQVRRGYRRDGARVFLAPVPNTLRLAVRLGGAA